MYIYIYIYVYIYVCCIIHLFIHYLHLLSFSFLFHCFYCYFLISFGFIKLNTLRSEQCSIKRCSGNIVSNKVNCSNFIIDGPQKRCHITF